MGIIDAIVFCCGIYMLYQTYIMRRDGVIPQGFYINKDMTIPKDADIAGFILDMYWKGIIAGVSACVSGILGLVSAEMAGLQLFATIFSFVFFGILVIFMIVLKKAQKKFLHIG